MSNPEFAMMADKIGYFEWANVGRNPLDDNKLGINFPGYAMTLHKLPSDCIMGNEPFDQSVITAFGLSELCTTQTPGPDCLARDAIYLRKLGVMAN